MEAFRSEHKQLEGFGFEDFLSDPNHPMVLNTTNDNYYVFWLYGNETLSMYEFYTVSKSHLKAPGLPWAEVTHVLMHCGQYPGTLTSVHTSVNTLQKSYFPSRIDRLLPH
jgi:hypothetical protein